MTGTPVKTPRLGKWKKSLSRDWQIYLMVIIPVCLLILFSYLPLPYIIIAFEKYSVKKGILGSKWVGLKYFKDFFSSPYFGTTLGNTIKLGLYGFVLGTVFNIFLALAMNEFRSKRLKKSIQMITYLPYFLSLTIVVGIMSKLFNYNFGIINTIIKAFGGKPANFMGDSGIFPHLYTWSGIWQGCGFGSIIYISALASVDPSLVEAATIDGATRLQRVRYIDLPTIMPTIAIMLILNSPGIINVGFDKAYLMQNSLNLSASELISTYVYKQGIRNANYSYSTAVGLVNSVAGTVMVVLSNAIARKLDPSSSLF